jgi:hypothetical protein
MRVMNALARAGLAHIRSYLPPLPSECVIDSRGHKQRRHTRAPRLLIEIEQAAEVLGRDTPRIVIATYEAARCRVQEYECRRALGVGGCVQRCHGTALTEPDQCGSLGPDNVEDQAEVVGPVLPRQPAVVRERVGLAGASAVKNDEAAEGRKSLQKMNNLWVLLAGLEMAPTREENEIQRTVADGLVGNVGTVLGLCVASLGGVRHCVTVWRRW